LPKDGASTVTLLLSLMALLVGAYSLDQVGPNTILLFLCCLLLALNGLYQSRATKPELGVVSSLSPGVGVGGGGGAGVGEGVVLGVGKNFRIVLHSHSFASARTKGDAIASGGEASAGDSVGMAMGDGGENAEEAEDASNTIPKRFIDGCEGNMKEARRRWDITSKWRREERVDDILNERQPHFRKIKEHYPHFNSGRGKAGHAIYWERPGEIALEPLLKAGVKTDDLCRHWIFVTEYQWAVLCKGDETAKSIAVIDVKGVGIWDLVGPKLECVKKCVGMANQHYPERSLVVYFVNASWFFTAVWGAIKPWVHPNTQRKVRGVFDCC
jgi:CRAL/TRIO domain